jgi:hypothetical protein
VRQDVLLDCRKQERRDAAAGMDTIEDMSDDILVLETLPGDDLTRAIRIIESRDSRPALRVTQGAIEVG